MHGLTRRLLCLGAGVGLDDPRGSLPVQDILWFCDYVLITDYSGSIFSLCSSFEEKYRSDSVLSKYKHSIDIFDRITKSSCNRKIWNKKVQLQTAKEQISLLLP